MRATRRAFEEFTAGWAHRRGSECSTWRGGTGDIPSALAEWDPRIEFTCLDVRADPWGRVGVRANALRLPFRDGSFDYVITSLFLHHLGDEAAAGALKEFDRVARRGLVMNDLLRRRRLYWWTKFFTLFGNEIVRYDGPLSVLKSFTVEELRRLASPYPYLKTRVCFGHRVILYGEKP